LRKKFILKLKKIRYSKRFTVPNGLFDFLRTVRQSLFDPGYIDQPACAAQGMNGIGSKHHIHMSYSLLCA
jgi:hypothetical protein